MDVYVYVRRAMCMRIHACAHGYIVDIRIHARKKLQRNVIYRMYVRACMHACMIERSAPLDRLGGTRSHLNSKLRLLWTHSKEISRRISSN